MSHAEQRAQLLRDRPVRSNNNSVTASSERANLRLSGTGGSRASCPTSRIERLTAGLNGSASLSEKLQANGEVQYIQNKGNNRPGTGYDELNPIMGFTWFGRNVDVGLLKTFMTDSTLRSTTPRTVWTTPTW